MKRALFVFAALAFAAPFSVKAADEEKGSAKSSSTLSDFKIGTAVCGPTVAETDLKGKAVILEFWGRNCGPCLAAMPHLSDLDKRYSKKGLVVIGAHAQDGTDEEIKDCVEGLKVKFAITKGAHSPISFSGIPRSFIFDATGKIVFDGHPGDAKFDKAVKEALKTVVATTGEGEEKSAFGKKEDKPAAATKPADKNAVLIPIRTWTNTDGKSMEAALVSVSGTTGTFKGKNGKNYNYSLEKLSEDDRKIIEEAQAEPAKE